MVENGAFLGVSASKGKLCHLGDSWPRVILPVGDSRPPRAILPYVPTGKESHLAPTS